MEVNFPAIYEFLGASSTFSFYLVPKTSQTTAVKQVTFTKIHQQISDNLPYCQSQKLAVLSEPLDLQTTIDPL